ncbi:kinase-like protein [Setomelanomma holmii]|uniref:Kinase-like protein n=1 Tax=Setomelanomma holmii TaxID=210430 RepID=A0A9P4HID5_9PLEO|nr:kinase-like protein [Setomelanomma holmii]
MSMFRRPGEDSSSSSEESYEETENEETSASHQDSVLSRIQTLDSTGSARSGDRPQPPRLEMRQSSTQNVRDLMLHALLEEKAINQAAKQLGKDASDPDVQRVGREAYKELARQISNNVDDAYASEEMRNHRATAQEGISKLTRSNLNRLAVVPEGASVSQALVSRPLNGLAPDLHQQPSTGFDMLSGISAPIELQLRGYPGLQTDRYGREFTELGVVGKGGYGRVFKAKHNLDGSFYAVKRIPVSPAKLAKIQEHGSDELESMLQEVRSLARFDHANIVRYHNAWLEFTTAPMEETALPPGTLLRPNRLLQDAAMETRSSANITDLRIGFEDLSFGQPSARPEDSFGAGIVFESSDNGNLWAETSKSEADNVSFRAQLMKSSKRKTRRGSQASQATIATISSTKSRMSAVEDVDEDADEDIETIPRSHVPQEPISEVSESMVSHSDLPGHLIPTRHSGPTLTLNVQMSLCETNLAAFLSADRSLGEATPIDRHCFHPCVSLELMNNIISGVDYLHAQGVVHRDLKPANVFLSLSTARHPPYGSVNLSSCKPCPQRERLHVTPRIGDFGLVAALDDSCVDNNTVSKPVGTEFYRPEANSRLSEKLDVFALGVMGFEMLQQFDTRMERIAALSDLRRGNLPDGFARDLGAPGVDIQHLIGSMVHADEQKRLSCEAAKLEIAKLIHVLKE